MGVRRAPRPERVAAGVDYEVRRGRRRAQQRVRSGRSTALVFGLAFGAPSLQWPNELQFDAILGAVLGRRQ